MVPEIHWRHSHGGMQLEADYTLALFAAELILLLLTGRLLG